jgi:hypothetical protein
MPHYFMRHDASRFQQLVVPALAASWRQRSFAPCRRLCEALLPVAQAFTDRYGTGPGELLLRQVGNGLPFNRDFWHGLVGEVLLFGATEVPRLPVAPDTLCCLLAPDQYRQEAIPREWFALIQQAHFGNRELIFGGGFYRPEQAGYNPAADVARLAEYLGQIDPERWTVADLRELCDVANDDRAEELAFARDCLASLRELYQEARQRDQVIVCEIL